MTKDFNFTFLTGTIVSTPSWVPLSNNKRALVFTLCNEEHYKLADGRPLVHENHIVVEVLGKNAEKYATELQQGFRYQVVGYIRVDEMRGSDKVRVRAFRIEDC